jgi:RNA polymerase-binding transcription factor DksA
MNTAIRKRLEKDLLTTGAQLRQLVAIDATTHERLVGRVKRLSDALHRLRAGTYGLCMECHEPTSPARLLLMPEVETCGGCQNTQERLARR